MSQTQILKIEIGQPPDISFHTRIIHLATCLSPDISSLVTGVWTCKIAGTFSESGPMSAWHVPYWNALWQVSSLVTVCCQQDKVQPRHASNSSDYWSSTRSYLAEDRTFLLLSIVLFPFGCYLLVQPFSSSCYVANLWAVDGDLLASTCQKSFLGCYQQN